MFEVQINEDNKPLHVLTMSHLPRIGEVIRFGTKPMPEGKHYQVLGVTHVVTNPILTGDAEQIGVMLTVEEHRVPVNTRGMSFSEKFLTYLKGERK
jgi:hypothetical protein